MVAVAGAGGMKSSSSTSSTSASRSGWFFLPPIGWIGRSERC
jgi:hypothetical protein